MRSIPTFALPLKNETKLSLHLYLMTWFELFSELYLILHTVLDLNYIPALPWNSHSPCSRHFTNVKLINNLFLSWWYIKCAQYYDIHFKQLKRLIRAYGKPLIPIGADILPPNVPRPDMGHLYTDHTYCGNQKIQPSFTVTSGETMYVWFSVPVKIIFWLTRLIFELASLNLYIYKSFVFPIVIDIDTTSAMSFECNKYFAMLARHKSVSFHHVKYHLWFGTIF